MQRTVKIMLFSINAFIILWLLTNTFFIHINSNLLVGRPEQPIIESVSASEIQPGDILLIHGDNWVDKIIKLVTQSPYSHVVGVVNSNQVVDVSPLSTVRYKDLQEYTTRADVFTCNRLSDDDRIKIVDYVTSRIGTSYDYNLVIWEASRFLLNWKWPYENKESSLCSTLWSEAYREAGIVLCPDVKFPVPGDLAKSRYLHKTLTAE